MRCHLEQQFWTLCAALKPYFAIFSRVHFDPPIQIEPQNQTKSKKNIYQMVVKKQFYEIWTHQFWHREVKVTNVTEIAFKISHHSSSPTGTFTQLLFNLFGLFRHHTVSKEISIFLLLVIAQIMADRFIQVDEIITRTIVVSSLVLELTNKKTFFCVRVKI